MTPRARAKIQIAAVVVLIAGGLIAVSGCDPRTLAYFLQPFESTIEPGGPSLEGKKVVILCNVTSGAVAEYPSLERDVPRILAEILRKKVKKITIVETDKVATWVEAHPRYTSSLRTPHVISAPILPSSSKSSSSSRNHLAT